MPYFQNATHFLVQAIIGIAIYAVLLRFWMQWVRADFRNQLGQFIITVTNPVVIPLRKLLPSIGTIDTATIVLGLLVCGIKVYVFSVLGPYDFSANLIQYAMMTLGVFIKYSIYLFIGAIFLRAIASWINPHSYNPILDVAHSISNPLTAPVRRIIPPIGGLDFSAVLVLFFLLFLLRSIVALLLHGLPI